MCKATKRFRLVEVIASAGNNSYSLKDEEVLRDAKKITAIEAYRVDHVSVAPSGGAVINNTVFAKAYLTLSTPGTDEVQYRVPFSDISKRDNNGQLYYVDIPPLAPTKCQIILGNSTDVVSNEVFLLGFHYES